MIIIDRAFKGTEDLHEYLRTQSGLKEATQEEREAWNYNTPLWTSPSNFIGCDLIYRGEEVGKIIGVNIRVSSTYKGVNKVISLETASGIYKFSYSSVRFFNRLYGKEQVLSLHPSRGGLYMWSRGFVMNEKEYKALYYKTEEYQKKLDSTMIKRHGVRRSIQSPKLKQKIESTMKNRYGVSSFLKRGSHYSAITETMMERYGVHNIIHSAEFIERCGQCTSKGEQEMVTFLVEELHFAGSMFYTTGDTRQAIIPDPETGTAYQVDFLNKEAKLIVEFYGDYWHCHPKTYAPDYIHDTNGRVAADIWEADAHRKERLEKLTGCKVLIVWESDWIADQGREKERLKSAVRDLSSCSS